MWITPKFLQRRCNVCKRDRERAIHEQVSKLQVCGVEQCPFYPYISDAIREAQKIELLSFEISKDEFLEGETAWVSWQTRNCKAVTLSSYGPVETSGTITIPVTRGMEEIGIRLLDLFDVTYEYKKKIRVHRKPALKIIQYKEKVLVGEPFFVRFEATNARNIFLKDESGNLVSDLTGVSFFESHPISKNARFILTAIGKFGGETTEEIYIEVFAPPIINHFKCDNAVKVDTSPVFFEFDYQNETKAEIFCDGILLSDVTGKKTFTHIVENKKQIILSPKFELVITGYTGTKIKGELANRISVYPQPTINRIISSPGNIVFYPEQITLTIHSSFCDGIFLSDGSNTRVIKPNDMVVLNPSSNTEYFLTPIGKQNFHGQVKSILIEVVHPIEIEARADKKITLPNLPVTISWEAKNHSQVIIEPGNIDVTNRDSYDIRLQQKTNVKVWGINKRDRKSVEIFIDVLDYPKFNQKTFGSLPKLDLQIPEIEIKIPALSRGESPRFFSFERISLPNFSLRTLRSLKDMTPKKEFSLFREIRNRMFTELKSLTRKE